MRKEFAQAKQGISSSGLSGLGAEDPLKGVWTPSTEPSMATCSCLTGGGCRNRSKVSSLGRSLLSYLALTGLTGPHRFEACAFVVKSARTRPLSTGFEMFGLEPINPLRQRMQHESPRTSSSSLDLSLPSPSNPLISSGDTWGNIAALSLTATVSQTLGMTTRIGRLLGPPVTAMAIAFLLGSVGVLPPGGSSGARALQLLSLQLATPLLLLGADVRDASRRCGPLLQAFVLASVGTVIASMAAMIVGPCGGMLTSAMGEDGLKIAAALMAKNVGGGINYIAVCRSLGADPSAVAAGLCVDNIFALVYFPVTSALAAGRPDLPDDIVKDGTETEADEKNDGDNLSVERVSTVLTLSAIATWLGEHFGGPSRALPISTFITVLFACLAPKRWVSSLRPAGETLGTVLLYFFFATAGSAGLSIAESVRAAFVPIGLFLLMLYGIHGTFLTAARFMFLSFSRKYNFDNIERGHGRDEGVVAPQRLLVASSAAIGGPATAAALAQANGWSSLTAPSLLVGNLGYAIATFAGLAFHAFFANYLY